jgi:asparagine synthase (glutamine-hydrolysing)
MCGIAGIVDWSGDRPQQGLLKAMTDSIAHRGPDGDGHYAHANVGFGHRRLSIIDIGGGHQPMSNEDSTVWITFNGEIYNYQDLRRELVAAGHAFQTHSDTEVIVHGFEEWGDALVAKLRGMFAFAVYDQKTGEMLIARDHFGIKPVVYYEGDDILSFASEIKALMVDPRVKAPLDAGALADYFEYGYVPAPKSILKNVKKLLPGHFIRLNVRRREPVVQRRYWKLDYSVTDESVTESAAIAELQRLLAESVKGQMVSDVPLGAFLSGGIDSSAVVALMARASADPIKTFSIGFQEERFTETKYARMVAAANKTDHHEHVVTPAIRDLLPRLVAHFDEPFSDASAVPTYYLCEMARKHVTVSLSGDGGDELFAGYDRYREATLPGAIGALPSSLRRAVFGPLSKVWSREWPAARMVSAAAYDSDERFVQLMRSMYGAVDVSTLLNRQLHSQLAGRESFGWLRGSFDPTTRDPLHRWLEVDANTYLPNDILTKVDITSMMNSLEVRVPLLDHKLAEYVARLPARLKLANGETKSIFKKTMESHLPREVLYRPKMGFGVPMRQWVTNELRDVVRGYLLDSSRVSGMLDPALLRTMVEDNEKNLYGSRTGGKLWWVLFFEMWHQDVHARKPGIG